MRFAVLIALLLPVSAACFVVDGASMPSAVADHFEGTANHDPLCSLIAAATDIDFSSERSAVLGEFASRSDLTEHEQIFIMDVVVEHDGFSDDNASVLTTLARNPRLTETARLDVGRRMRHVTMFASDRAEVVRALSETAGTP